MNTLKLILKRFAGLFILAFLLWGCTFTTSKNKLPEFIIDNKTLGTKLDSLIICEHSSVQGLEKKTSGQVSTELIVRIVNCTNTPKSKETMNALGKEIAITIKHALKNQNDFDSYKILFITQVETQSAGGKLIKKSTTTLIFKKDEL
jgi:hypothetical protein